MIVPELQRILFKSQKQDAKTIWDKLPKEVQIYVFKKIREINCVDLGKLYQGAGKRPRQCCLKGPKIQETATRGPEGPESAQNTRVRGPEGPEDEQSSASVSALDSATICFSRFSPKSRFLRPNLSTLMTTKMHENYSRVSYSQHKHRVKKIRVIQLSGQELCEVEN